MGYANGAVVPTDTPAVAAATSAHLAARGTPALHTGYVAHIGYAGYPFAGHLIGKREAESEAAPAAHLATKGTPILQDVAVPAVAHVGYAGYAGWPYGHYIGKREADSDAYLGYGYGLGYGIQHVPAVTSVG